MFSLAATLFHLITGRKPFAATDRDAALAQARAGLPSLVPELSHVPRAVEDVLRAGLEPDPKRRVGLEEFRALLPCPARLRITLATASPDDKRFQPLASFSGQEDSPVVRVNPSNLLRIEATADADGYLTILNFGSTGDVDRLLPNPQATDNALMKDQPQRVTVQMTPPGPDHVAIIWTRRPNTLAAEEWRDHLAAGRITGPERGMEFRRHERMAWSHEAWSAVVVTVSQQGTES